MRKIIVLAGLTAVAAPAVGQQPTTAVEVKRPEGGVAPDAKAAAKAAPPKAPQKASPGDVKITNGADMKITNGADAKITNGADMKAPGTPQAQKL